jgi:hypothetical protein
MGVLEASEAVSGRNILILPIYASVLRPSRGAALRTKNGRRARKRGAVVPGVKEQQNRYCVAEHICIPGLSVSCGIGAEGSGLQCKWAE